MQYKTRCEKHCKKRLESILAIILTKRFKMHFKSILKSVWGNPFKKRVEESILKAYFLKKRVLTKRFGKYLKTHQ